MYRRPPGPHSWSNLQQDRVLRACRGVYERGSLGGRRKRTMWVSVGVLLHRWGVDLCAGSEKGDGLKMHEMDYAHEGPAVQGVWLLPWEQWGVQGLGQL